jgi:outer membrane murein-binding lipoprotein Lpp
MKRILLVTAIAGMALVLFGCAGSQKRINKNAANISILENRTNNIKADIGNLNKQVNKLIIQVGGLGSKIEQIPVKREGTDKLGKEVNLIEHELAKIEQRLDTLEESNQAAPPVFVVPAPALEEAPVVYESPVAYEEAPIAIEQEEPMEEYMDEPMEEPAPRISSRANIKVLTGSDDLSQAKILAEFLTDSGFPVKAIDYATSRNFKYDTVYFGQEFENVAYRMAEALGDNSIVKIMTWDSVFDIIVVKGYE